MGHIKVDSTRLTFWGGHLAMSNYHKTSNMTLRQLNPTQICCHVLKPDLSPEYAKSSEMKSLEKISVPFRGRLQGCSVTDSQEENIKWQWNARDFETIEKKNKKTGINNPKTQKTPKSNHHH